jgi:hypothetical protein
MRLQGNFTLVAAGLVLSLFGCRVDSYGPGASASPGCDCSSDGSNGSAGACTGGQFAQADQSCVPFCDRLEECGLVSVDAGAACLDYCHNAYTANPTNTQTGCSCVVADWCGTLTGPTAYDCPGAPIPPSAGTGTTGTTGGSTGTVISTTGSTGISATTSSSSGTVTVTTSGTSVTSTSSSSSSSSSSSGGTTSAGACTQNIDCSDNQDCVSGSCLSRCHASCECATGESCVNNYCLSSVPPPTSCTVDCECNAGQTCVNNQCH